MKKALTFTLLGLLLTVTCFAGPQIKLKSSTFDPLEATSAATLSKEASDASADGTRYYIVQFEGPILDEWKAEASEAGAELFDYIPDYAFIARASNEAINKIKKLPFVRWIGDFAPEYRLSPRLKTTDDQDVVIQFFPGADTDQISQKISAAGGKTDGLKRGKLSFRTRLHASSLKQLARTAGISWIEPKPDRKICNNIARGIMTVNNVWTDVGLYGAGQTVAVADTGLDVGANNGTTLLSADFRGRLSQAYALARTDWNDQNGHGTHVAGSILGNGSLSGSNPASHSYVGSFAGVAPEASLVFQSVGDSSDGLSGLPSDLNDLFTQAYNAGAYIHSDSWGADLAGTYDYDASRTDYFLWNHKDALIVMAAGNKGVDGDHNGVIDPDSLDSPGTAKNCITVGATESLTTGVADTWRDWGFSYEPLASDNLCNNASGMAAFSSRGPTNDNRIKPDICAPGCFVISCRSHDPSAGTQAGIYDNNYLYDLGTSMATPLVSGACALTREYYIKKRGMTPSGALIKATLLNGAFDMTPGQYAGFTEIPARPNSVEGWGRVDLANAIEPPSPIMSYPIDSATGISTNGSVNYTFYCITGGAAIHAMLVWMDPAGSLHTNTELVNNLDLKITAPSGATYTGNNTTDTKNNVEGITITNPTVGTYTVNVKGVNVPTGPQPYALVVTGPLTNVSPTVVSKISDLKGDPDGTVITMMAKSVSAGTDQFKGKFYIEETDKSAGIQVCYGSGGGPAVTMDQIVNVTGTLSTVDGERVLINPIVY